MKILLVDIHLHIKNRNALFSYDIIIDTIYSIDQLDKIDLTIYDCIYSPYMSINVLKYTNSKFIFGPHFSCLPEEKLMTPIIGPNSVYILTSEWIKNVFKYNPICKNIDFRVLPFAVDTNKFNEIKTLDQREKIFIYVKRRKDIELDIIKNLLNKYNMQYQIFNYIHKYPEEFYLDYLHNSKFGIWLGAHETQGFALEEALSCNIPLFIWNVESLVQEEGANYEYYHATTIPYWSKECGEVFYREKDMENKFNKFLSRLSTYTPRKYILENLSKEVCQNKLFDIIKYLKTK